MAAPTPQRLPLQLEPGSRALDALTARTVRLALRPGPPDGAAVAALLEAAGGDTRLLDAARARIDRTLAEEWSDVAARAADLLAAAQARAHGMAA